MIPFFPQQISERAIVTYLAALVLVSIVFFNYAMLIGYIVLGIIFVSVFFVMTHKWSIDWAEISKKFYVGRLFSIAVTLRLTWVVLSYFHYIEITGVPFEVGAADAMGYHGEAEWLASDTWSRILNYYTGNGAHGISDMGYLLYLIALYKIIGPVIIIPRVIKALLSTWMCILLYRLSSRMFGEKVGRMAGIMCALMPNLIIYCGYHLKETEMMFLLVAFMERTDYLLREHKYNIWTISTPLLLAGSLFFFRTVLGAVAVFAFVSAVLFANTPSMKRGTKRIAIIGWSLLCLIIA